MPKSAWDQNNAAPGGGLPDPTKVTTFTADGTWTRDTNAVRYRFTGSASGGGGGGGGRYAVTPFGGSGGQGGGFFDFEIPASDLAATTYTVTIGNGGVGGSAAVVNDTAGGNGGNGGDLTVTNGANTLLQAEGGKGGSGGTDTASVYVYDKGKGLFVGGPGAQQSTVALSTPVDAQDTQGSAPGGGCGGAVGANNYAGSAGGITYYRPQTRAAGGAAIGGGAGSAGVAGNNPQLSLGCGGGGGGGGASQGAVGGVGGAGISGSGGGGGGAVSNGFNSGAGGVGGKGFLIVEEIY